VPQVSYTATFRPEDSLDRIRQDLACPACGHEDPAATHHWISENQMRIFCEGCGAFVTVLVSREQATAIHRWSQSMPAINEDPLLRRS
jgi:transcription elongation factor Elf1